MVIERAGHTRPGRARGGPSRARATPSAMTGLRQDAARVPGRLCPPARVSAVES